MLTAAFVAWWTASLPQAPSPSIGRAAGDHAGRSRSASWRRSSPAWSSRRPRLAVDQRTCRPDHLRHDRQHLRGRHHRPTSTCSSASTPRHPARLRSTTRAPAGVTASRPRRIVKAFLGPGPVRSSCSSRSSCSRSSSSGRDGASARGPSGEHPRAAETVGIDVIRMRYRNVILGGVFAGLAGAYLTIDFGDSFQGEMTQGAGFIALAALIFGRWTPVGALGAALLFTFSTGLYRSIQFAPPEGCARRRAGRSALPDLRCAAVPDHDHRAGGRRRSQPCAGRGWAAVRAGVEGQLIGSSLSWRRPRSPARAGARPAGGRAGRSAASPRQDRRRPARGRSRRCGSRSRYRLPRR